MRRRLRSFRRIRMLLFEVYLLGIVLHDNRIRLRHKWRWCWQMGLLQ